MKQVSLVVFIASILVVALIAFQFGAFPEVIPSLPFEEVDQGLYSGIGIRTNYVIDHLESWETLWTDVHNTSTSTPELPEVDFASEVIIAVFLGDYATGGYIAQITSIVSSETGYRVYIREEHPGPSCFVTMSTTRPYHIVKSSIDSSQIVEFEYNIVVRNCP